MNKLFDLKKSAMGDDFKYSRAITTPQYTPSEVSPHISSLCSTEKYVELMRNINKSTVADEEKLFLKLAAARHIVFNYALIADYYTHASPEMQTLMEQSALVILDIDDAIEYGYVKLSEKMRQLVNESKQFSNRSETDD